MEDKISPEAIKAIQQVLDAESERKTELALSSYDGVLGIPPGWIPAPIIERFKQTRDRVLDDWRYTSEQACEWIDCYCRIGQENDDWYYPAAYPNGQELDSDYFLETIGILANLRWAISLGPEEGLKRA